MSGGPVTARYATALFELAREKGLLERVEADVELLAGELADARVAAFLFDARVPEADKRRRLETLASRLHPLSANFLRLLHDKGRLEVLRGLRAAFRRQLNQERNATEGQVESARPLGPAELASIAGALSHLLEASGLQVGR